MCSVDELKKELNEYLFLEFGLGEIEKDQARINVDWPFQLQLVLEFSYEGITHYLFEFEEADELFYAEYGEALQYYPTAGVSPDQVRLEIIGRNWISHRHPVDLNTSKGSESGMPTMRDRRKRFDELASSLHPVADYKLLEGLYLETTREHLALIQFGNEPLAHIVGDRLKVTGIPHPLASPWRRLSLGIGKLVIDGRL